MGASNFEITREGKTVRIWFDSFAEVEKRMISFSRDFSSEIEADLVRQSIEKLITNEFEAAYFNGIDTGKKSVVKAKARFMVKKSNAVLKEAEKIIKGERY